MKTKPEKLLLKNALRTDDTNKKIDAWIDIFFDILS
jgi:hypothetical protein